MKNLTCYCTCYLIILPRYVYHCQKTGRHYLLVVRQGADFQARATYEPGTVVVWVILCRIVSVFVFPYIHPLQDNRVTGHSATGDFPSGERRHAVRLTPSKRVSRNKRFRFQ